jgi:hypothetical protein
MSATDLQDHSELERIERWRAQALEQAGYLPAEAALLARRQDVDLHVAVDLLRKGCPRSLALRILV